MGYFRCPRCGTTAQADDPSLLVCPKCGYPNETPPAASWQGAPPASGPGAASGAWQAPSGGQQQPQWGGPQYSIGPTCPRCGSGNTKKGEIPVWAIVLAVVLCPIGLLFLLVKDASHCYNCGMQWKM